LENCQQKDVLPPWCALLNKGGEEWGGEGGEERELRMEMEEGARKGRSINGRRSRNRQVSRWQDARRARWLHGRGPTL
jgi:hypothetical protein